MTPHVPSAVSTDAVAVKAIFNSAHLLAGTFNPAERRKLYEAGETLYQPPPCAAEHVQVRNNPCARVTIADASSVFPLELCI